MVTTMRAALCLAVFLAAGCAPKPQQPQGVDLRIGMKLRDACRALKASGAFDWTSGCSYLRLPPFPEGVEPQRSYDWRHYDLPNGMLISLWSESPATTFFAQRHPTDDLTLSSYTVVEIEVANSRMLRVEKAETTYLVDALEHKEGLRMRLSGLKAKRGKGAFLYKGMMGREALATMAGAGKASVPLDASEMKRMHAVLDEQRRKPYFPARDKLEVDGRWVEFSLSAGLELFVQLKPQVGSGQDLVTLMFCRHAPAGEKETLVEYELLDVLDPILDGRKRSD